jgi:hypothetical protein
MDSTFYLRNKSIVPTTRTFLVRLLLALSFIAALQGSEGKEFRLLFVGDILLSRQVRVEIEETQQSPWRNMKDLFRQADWIGGNLEGSVGEPGECESGANPCFSIPSKFISFLQEAGFRAMSVENNHAGDLGEKGRDVTKQELRSHGIMPMHDQFPVFLRFGDVIVGMISLSTSSSRDEHKDEIPSVEARQRIRLARQLSNLVIVSIHWGSELLSWPSNEQRRQAEWLIAQGTDIIVGHHPHVIQPMEVISGKPVYFSLGNHLFDQKYPETKEGLIAEIEISGSAVHCGGILTRAPTGSSVSDIANNSEVSVRECDLHMTNPPTVNGYILRPRQSIPVDDGELVIEGVQSGKVAWVTRPVQAVSLQTGRLGGPNAPENIFSLQLHQSSIDNENGLRPYVYEVGPNGLIAKWRGSALAWPLLDAVLLQGEDPIICALHRGDSFIMLDPKTKSRRVAAYRWNGFGFSGIDNPETIKRCSRQLESQ